MKGYGEDSSIPPDRGIMRSHGKVDGLSVVDVFSSEPYPDEEDAYLEDSDTASLSQMSWDSSSQDESESISTVESDSSPESKVGKRGWKKTHVTARNPWKELKKVKRELHEKSGELSDERRAHRELESQLADMKLFVAKAEEQKDEYIALIQRANDERDLAKVTAENEKYQLMERLKESEAHWKMLEDKLRQFEGQSNRTKRRSSRGAAIIRGGRDIASRRWRLGRRNPNPSKDSAVPLHCIEE